MDQVANFIKSHQGFYVSHNDRGVTLRIDVLNINTRELEVEFHTVSSIREAREVLGY